MSPSNAITPKLRENIAAELRQILDNLAERYGLRPTSIAKLAVAVADEDNRTVRLSTGCPRKLFNEGVITLVRTASRGE